MKSEEAKNELEIIAEQSNVASNGVYYFFRLVSRSLMAFIVSIFLVRLLGPVNYGVYTIVTTYWGLFLMLSAVGIGSAVQYGIAKYRAKNRFASATWIVKHYFKILIATSTIGSVAMFFLSGPISAAYKSPQMAELLQILAVGLLGYSIMETFSLNVYIGFQKLKYSFVSGLVFDFLRLLQGSLIVFYFGLLGVITFYDVIYLVVAIISVYFIYKIFRQNPTKTDKLLRRKDVSELNKYNFFSYAINLIGYFYGPFIALFLGVIAPSLAAVSFYTVGSQMAAIISMPSGALAAAFFATNTKYFENKRYKDFYRMLGLVLKYIALTTIPLAIGSLIAAGPLILYFYRSALSDAVTPFMLIVTATLITSIFSPITSFLSAVGKQKHFMYSYAAGAIAGVAGLLFLVPLLLENGAALASMIAMFTALGVNLYFVSKYIRITLPYKIIGKISFAALVMGAYIYIIDAIVPLAMIPVVLVSGLGLYTAIVYYIRILTLVDIKFFIKLGKLDGVVAKVFNLMGRKQ